MKGSVQKSIGTDRKSSIEFSCVFDADNEVVENVHVEVFPQMQWSGTSTPDDRAIEKVDLIGRDKKFSGASEKKYPPGIYVCRFSAKKGTEVTTEEITDVALFSIEEPSRNVHLQRHEGIPTRDQGFWSAIRLHTERTGFDQYAKFLDGIVGRHIDRDGNTIPIKRSMSLEDQASQFVRHHENLVLQGPHAYSLLKFATEAFLASHSGLCTGVGEREEFEIEDEHSRLQDTGMPVEALSAVFESYLQPLAGTTGQAIPYLKRIADTLATGSTDADRGMTLNLLKHRTRCPSMVELIWSYWMEEGLLAQTTGVIARRFQNARDPSTDRLREFALDPLRPLNNFMWGYIHDEIHRTGLVRRAHEYANQYGFSLIGKAVEFIAPVDQRVNFLEVFHTLLHKAAQFYREDADTTVVADAFPLLNALRDAHMVLAEGAHNQFGDMAWSSRVEMLTQQWMLARPEMREFLRGRYMVPYQEPWMGTVDSMRKLQGWGDVSVSHFRQLAVDGERILLTVRYGDWSDTRYVEDHARNWVKYWKPEIQRYIHSYQSVTGVDLSADINDTQEASRRFAQPSTLLLDRMPGQRATRRAAALGQRVRPMLQSPGNGARELLPSRVTVKALRFENGE